MELAHNHVFVIQNNHVQGFFRVIINSPQEGGLVLVKIQDIEDSPPNKNDPTENKKTKKNKKLHSRLIWVDSQTFKNIYQDDLRIIQIDPEGIILESNLSLDSFDEHTKEVLAQRKLAMENFLDIENLKFRILNDKGLGGLVKESVEKSKFSRMQIYKLFSTLCKLGFSETNLLPRFDRCGAPGILRPCDYKEDGTGRKKAGRKTVGERIAIACGSPLPAVQPGITTDWRNLILAADSRIEQPKPRMPARITIILNSNFIKKYTNQNGVLTPIDLTQGEYPNKSQIKRVLTEHYTDIERASHKTTANHFVMNQRGLTGKNWEGVGGPGHTWAIDSSIGDIYLRSSCNRAWIAGRPVVYTIVDVWSTAIMGFYVCYSGPSWQAAKVAIYSSVIDPSVIGNLWGHEIMLKLDPLPTLPYRILCDRGEYLSKGGRALGAKLIPSLSYAPPHRGDFKGGVEVTHRIAKDEQFLFIPGAIDARRREYELRKFNPNESVMTIREYVAFLNVIYTKYNFGADRSHRLDAHMKSDGVIPTPAGLWNWGFKNGLGSSRFIHNSEITSHLLPSSVANITKNGVIWSGGEYSLDNSTSQEWACHARNYGAKNISINYFPGTTQKIWTPNDGGKGLLELSLSDYKGSSGELTIEEIADAHAFHVSKNANAEHNKTLLELRCAQLIKSLKDKATKLTKDADQNYSGIKPTITEARQIETMIHNADLALSKSEIQNQNSSLQITEVQQDHAEMMESILQAMTERTSE